MGGGDDGLLHLYAFNNSTLIRLNKSFMTKVFWLLAFFSGIVAAQSSLPRPASVPLFPTPVERGWDVMVSDPGAMTRKPPIDSLSAAFAASGLRWAFARVLIDYEADGIPFKSFLSASSGDEALDAAIQAWALHTRVSPDSRGRMRVAQPFFFIVEDIECQAEEPRDPHCLRDYSLRDFAESLMSPLDISLFALWGADEAEFEIYFDHDASGKLTRAGSPMLIDDPLRNLMVRLRSARIDAASAGVGRLRFRVVAVADEREAAMKAGDDVILIWKTPPGDDRVLVNKRVVESRLSILQQIVPVNVPADVSVARIAYDADGVITGVASVRKTAGDPAKLQSMLDDLLLGLKLKERPAQAGRREVKVYPDGSVLPVEGKAAQPAPR